MGFSIITIHFGVPLFLDHPSKIYPYLVLTLPFFIFLESIWSDLPPIFSALLECNHHLLDGIACHQTELLLMEEILHHLGCIKLPINWCRISAINSMRGVH